MLSEDLPKCLCDKKKWKPGSAMLSADLNQQVYQCGNCGRAAIFLSHHGGNVLVIAKTVVQELSEATYTWLNEVVLPTWRDCEERLAQARKPVEQRWCNYACDEVGIPRGSEFEKVPEAKHQQWRDFWRLLNEYPLYRTPAGFERPLIPPQLPEGLVAYLLLRHQEGNTKWEEIKREDSMALPVPPDPIRVKHDAFYNEVFTTLGQNLGHDFVTEHVVNQYCGAKNEPWFQFTLGNNTLVVGPRKRVTAIKVISPEGLNTEGIRNAAKKEETTYYANCGWQSEDPVAMTLEVHAWNKEQLLQFLNIIGTESLGASVI